MKEETKILDEWEAQISAPTSIKNNDSKIVKSPTIGDVNEVDQENKTGGLNNNDSNKVSLNPKNISLNTKLITNNTMHTTPNNRRESGATKDEIKDCSIDQFMGESPSVSVRNNKDLLLIKDKLKTSPRSNGLNNFSDGAKKAGTTVNEQKISEPMQSE